MNSFRTEFEQWQEKHSVVYDSVEHAMSRMAKWVDNHEFIQKHNTQTPTPSYTLGHNKFSDMTSDEFQQINMLGKYSPGNAVIEKKLKERQAIKKVNGEEHPSQAEFRYLREKSVSYFDDLFSSDDATATDDAATTDDAAATDDAATTDDTDYTDDNDTDGLPDEIDWVAAGAVTPVKNQGRCGSCWAFSSTGAIEGAHFVATGELISLSEQNLMDCDKIDHACEGGLMEDAFKFEEAGNGLCTEEEYPYLATDDSECNADCSKVAHTQVKDYTDIEGGDKHGLIASIIMQPTSIAMAADSLSFQFYSGGVFDDDDCGANGQIDHGVLAVGYGHDEASGHAYFKIKNSWGDGWGDGGYFKIKRKSPNEFGACAILAYMTAPLVV
jgi:C1A family cysteine protease